MVAAALIDRLVHHATMITLKGKSYRLRERAAASSNTPRARARPTDLMTRRRRARRYAGSQTHQANQSQTATTQASPPHSGSTFAS